MLSRFNSYEKTIIDKVSIPQLLSDQSFKRNSEGDWEQSNFPTPGNKNPVGIALMEAPLLDMKVFPNLIEGQFSISIQLDRPGDLDVSMFDLNGRKIAQFFEQCQLRQGVYTFNYDLYEGISSGIYLIQCNHNNTNGCRKVIVK